MAYRIKSLGLSDWAYKQRSQLGAIAEEIRWRLIGKTRIRKRLAVLTATRGSIDTFEIAELLGQSHAAVLNTLDRMLGARALPPWCQPADRLGKRAFRLNRTGLTLLAMNLPGERPLHERQRIIELFNEMWARTNDDHRRAKQRGARVARLIDKAIGW